MRFLFRLLGCGLFHRGIDADTGRDCRLGCAFALFDRISSAAATCCLPISTMGRTFCTTTRCWMTDLNSL